MNEPNSIPLALSPSLRAAGLNGVWLRALGALALVATLVARTLSPALLGWRAGIADLIQLFDRYAAPLTTQVFVGLGVLVAVRMLISAVRVPDLGVLLRLVAMPAGAAVITLVLVSVAGRLTPTIALALASISALLAVAAAPQALSRPETRAGGVALGAVGASAMVQLFSRVLAIRASDQALASLFEVAQGIATFGFALDLLALCVIALWLSSGRTLSACIVGVAVVLAASLLTRGAIHGTGSEAASWEVLASRAVSELARNPAPLVGIPLRYTFEICALLVAGVALAARRPPVSLCVAFAFLLVARGSTDIPSCALSLLIASLLIPLSATRADPATHEGTA